MSGLYIGFIGKRETVLGEKYISFGILEMEVYIREKIKKPAKIKYKNKQKKVLMLLEVLEFHILVFQKEHVERTQ